MARKTFKKTLLIVLIMTLIVIVAGVAAAWVYHRPAAAPRASTAPSANVSRQATATPVTITLPNAKPVTARIADYDTDSDQWALVDKTHPLKDSGYAPSSVERPDVAERNGKSDTELSVRSDVAPAVEKLFAGAKAAGYDLVVASGYRPAALQKQYFDAYAASDGIEAANRYSALPGQSEHQTGLAFDITTPSRACYLVACFADTPEARWVAVHAHEYGFIIRYPQGKESVTGYEYEPWHLRYLGTDLATAVYASGLTYEETWPYLMAARDRLRANGLI